MKSILQVSDKSSLLLRKGKFFQVDSTVELLLTHPEYPFLWSTFLDTDLKILLSTESNVHISTIFFLMR